MQSTSPWTPREAIKFLRVRRAEIFGNSRADLDNREKYWLLAMIADAAAPEGHETLLLGSQRNHRAFATFLSVKVPNCTDSIKRARDLLIKQRPEDKKRLEGVSRTVMAAAITFSNLTRLESAWLDDDGGAIKVEGPGVTREPWVRQPSRDYFGLALSGGGIRSATFNLGLLQALGEKGVLDHLDYLSTVSGGGYIGGFWTAWRQRRQAAATAVETFPVRETGPASQERERPEIRHLREFSRFLIPRVGFFQSETWMAVAAVLGGTLLSLLVISSAVALTLFSWYLVTTFLTGVAGRPFSLPACPAWVRAVVFGGGTAVLHLVSESRLYRLGKMRELNQRRRGSWLGVAAAVLAALGWWALWQPLGPTCFLGEYQQELRKYLLRTTTLDHSALATGAPAAVWLAIALVLLLVRGVSQRLLDSGYRTAFDRAITRCLAPSLVCAMATAIWCIASRLTAPAPGLRAAHVGMGAAGFAAVFLWLRDWLQKPAQETNGSAVATKALRWLRPILPQLAAVVAAGLFILLVATFVQASMFSWGWLVAVVAVFVSSLFWFDPALIGLHEFYRARIARCFLGAARATAPTGSAPVVVAATVEEADDDLKFADLRELWGKKPLHLVCCAANNLSGDVLGSLYRGARSAVLSPLGLSLGNVSSPRDQLSFSAALTASAAAFNSQMGGLSMKLGPAVAFLMCTLNLRLGLWIRHPLSSRVSRIAPGWYFFLEAMARSRSDQTWDRQAPWLYGALRQLHLSDGGHFENLGLYELVRRHCRNIIVSDASADPAGRFDDLANAIRRVREDFGVEIEIDLTPLRKNESGFARQHALMGTIHFDGLDGTDKGALIYFKPALTGDESVDVLEFHSRNPAFPHDSTGEQFYDEAQWESYRRLGQHAGAAIVGLPVEDRHGGYVDKLFLLANQRLQAVDEKVHESFLHLTERCEQLMADLRDHAPRALRMEFFPEVEAAVPGPRLKTDDATAEAAQVAYYIMMVAQTMEDVWFEAELDERWAHPLNEGWMSFFRRWAATPSFRTWWPILRPLYNPSFRDFVKDRFDIRVNEAARNEHGPGAKLTLREFDGDRDANEPAMNHLRASGHAAHPTFVYELELEASEPGRYLKPIQVGLLTCHVDPAAETVTWNSDGLFTLPTLAGAGFQSRFLDAVIERFGGSYTLWVSLGSPASPRVPGARKQSLSRAARTELAQRITFYKSRDFRYTNEYPLSSSGGPLTRLVRAPK